MNAKLTPDDVIAIRRAAFRGCFDVEIFAAEYGVTKRTVRNALYGRTWPHLPIVWREPQDVPLPLEYV